ncbi:MAG TPA: hypothetical protein VGJ66_26325 [Pyrinomonadaceae bacterium]
MKGASQFTDMGKTIGYLVGGGVLVGLGVFVFVVAVRRMAATFPPGGGATTGSRLRIFALLILGLLVASVGGALLLAGFLG